MEKYKRTDSHYSLNQIDSVLRKVKSCVFKRFLLLNTSFKTNLLNLYTNDKLNCHEMTLVETKHKR